MNNTAIAAQMRLPLVRAARCPDCGGPVVRAEGYLNCPVCGYSRFLVYKRPLT